MSVAELASSPSPSRDVVVIIPAYREASGIRAVVEEVRQSINPVVLVINRPSDDSTGEEARRIGAVVVNQAGAGKGDAIRIGFDYVRENYPNARYIGLVDADCTYPAYPFVAMRRILDARPWVGMVVGQRENLENNGLKSDAFAVGNHLLGGVHRALNRVALTDPLSGLRLFRAAAVRDWSPCSRGFDIECELNVHVGTDHGLGIEEIPIPYRSRVGEKKLRFRDGARILARMVALALRRRQPPLAGPPPQPSATTLRE